MGGPLRGTRAGFTTAHPRLNCRLETPIDAPSRTTEVAFGLPITYWPARTGVYWWDSFESAEVEHDFELASAMGFHEFGINLVWHVFQPDGERVPAQPMRDLERVLDVAAGTGTTVLVTLFPAVVSGKPWIPSWLLDEWAPRAGEIMASGSPSNRPARNLFDDERATGAGLRLTREVLASFAEHPGCKGWVLGNRLTAVSKPASASRFGSWLARLVETARSAGGQNLWYGIGGRDVIESAETDFAAIRNLDVGVLVDGGWRPPWARCPTADWATFLALFVSAVGSNRVMIAADGFDRESRGQDSGRFAKYLESTMSGAQAGGAAGCLAPALFDDDRALGPGRPFHGAGEPRQGLLRPSGEMTVAGDVWREAQDGKTPTAGAAGVAHELAGSDLGSRGRDPNTFAREYYQAMMRE